MQSRRFTTTNMEATAPVQSQRRLIEVRIPIVHENGKTLLETKHYDCLGSFWPEALALPFEASFFDQSQLDLDAVSERQYGPTT